MENQITNNIEAKRFELHKDGQIALVQYQLFDGGISFLHTEVPPELGGQGIAAKLAKHVLDYAAENHLKVKPYCPYINAYIDKHPEYQTNSLFHNKAE